MVESPSNLPLTEPTFRRMLEEVLHAATPHPVHHPTMWAAWRKAEDLLGIPRNKSNAIQTSDSRLEEKLLRDYEEWLKDRASWPKAK